MSKTAIYIRTYLARITIIVAALAMLASYFLISPEANIAANELQVWNSNIVTFTLFVGLLTIYFRYGRSIMNRAPKWPFHLYCMALIAIWIVFGLNYGLNSDTYQTAYLSTKITLHIAILGQLIFFASSAMYRTFRIRSLRTAVFAMLAVTMIILNAPWLSAPYPIATTISFWLLDNPSMAGARAMVLCGGIGGIILGIRILLGLERGALRATGRD